MGCFKSYNKNKIAKRLYCKSYKDLCDKRKKIVNQIIELEKMED